MNKAVVRVVLLAVMALIVFPLCVVLFVETQEKYRAYLLPMFLVGAFATVYVARGLTPERPVHPEITLVHFDV